MLYYVNITTPANTSASEPKEMRLPVSGGIIRRVTVRYRYGSANLCGLRILSHEVQVFPFNKDDFFISMPELYECYLDFPLDQPPYELIIQTYNNDDTYDHLCSVGIEIDIARSTGWIAWLLRELGVSS
jgi:hypothetical protein